MRLVYLLLVVVIKHLMGQCLLESTVVLLLHPAELGIFHFDILSCSSLILFRLVLVHEDTLSLLVLHGP